MKFVKSVKICYVAAADITLRFILLEQMKFLRQIGFEVWAVSSPGKWTADLQKAGIHFAPIKITRKLYTPFIDVYSLWKLFWFFRKNDFAIVHTHTPKASFLGQIAAALARVPIRMYTVHGLFFTKDSSWRRKLAFGAMEKIISLLVHKAFFVNREDMETVQKTGIYPAAKIGYIGADIDLDQFNPDRYDGHFLESLRNGLRIPLSSPVVGIVARLVWEKGFRDLFSAMQLIIREMPHAVLLVVGPAEPEKGDGFSKDVVKEYGIEDNVVFAGERIDVEAMYALMDVFVLPSYREGLGLSVLEASAMERPVVATDIRGCRESVEDGKTGFLVPVRNPERLAKAIVNLLCDKAKQAQMGKAGREKVRREFSKEITFGRLEKTYTQFLSLRGKNI
ncbi:MAG: hypothetical protein A3E07_00350 [Candidatus Wildermuthbacteria bacterium RIFCSPHIGHO2_12_FULL_45_9]|uniref:Glycosyl transferase family 1 n=1 Tax=Candidatus Wildermuthbacteria bacterium RIFCSPHIGHO2_02_FULL_45_25 TaxID=1802450 RepID=A0A1G2R2C2_9BACT|nr:MAG: hypothetical protein A3C04_03610 [Candidatus Wildermuthbacteria bacterium RIFCSPHIGHO2_02_FULL_45_25]OHA71213.1 MAG: hypothetical protein A3E07_00350 [Candidatus Wildermuthbacteria bacterium RIFCSPHIGHO2_12_FULL_45_9]